MAKARRPALLRWFLPSREDFTTPVIVLVVANLFPLVGAVVFDWSAGEIVLLYWAENIIVGFYNILKMLTAKAEHPIVYVGRAFAALFFCVHFGGFCAVHGVFVLALGGLGEEGTGGAVGGVMSGTSWPGPLVFVQLLFAVIAAAWRAMPAGLEWPLAGLFVSHGISYVLNFIVKGERDRATTQKLMAAPYARIVILHVAIIAGGVPVILVGSPFPLLALLVAFKVGVDIRLHARSHGRDAGGGQDDGAEEPSDARAKARGRAG